MSIRQRKTAIVAFCSLVLLFTVSSSAECIKHPIDEWLEQAPDSSTLAMIESHQKAIRMWEEELSKNFHALISILPSDQRSDFQKAQQDWNKFKKSEFTSIESITKKVAEPALRHIQPVSFTSSSVFFMNGPQPAGLKGKPLTSFCPR